MENDTSRICPVLMQQGFQSSYFYMLCFFEDLRKSLSAPDLFSVVIQRKAFGVVTTPESTLGFIMIFCMILSAMDFLFDYAVQG
ncbi:hypothetical protein PSDVSF_24460 [Pseudodesulfovibrio sediminis]|uniref:Uncharacterized protein n=1 Tax=Pseudodesulfovibrio sediminis TaxID=2810563 RepID=A0ABM7P6P9_9BACT|nr:hypothetical protein PSDVSF_24460 [Pseudodesulfovibrio sediminis]